MKRESDGEDCGGPGPARNTYPGHCIIRGGTAELLLWALCTTKFYVFPVKSQTAGQLPGTHRAGS
ncbi:hypothetical protein LDENG_00280220 [Lucifuga dentata]|nr:hypothetical protein LDENG_00280220 [Lucifuga dentata]